jgi:16S rRNA G966 N2-methylase RsmD
MTDIHSLIKFWARKDPELISRQVKNAKLLADPFCGSGSSGFSAIFTGASGLLSDINPVSVFIAYNILSNETIKSESIETMREVCLEIENEVYTLSNLKKVNYAVWKDDEVISLKLASGKETRDKSLIKEYIMMEENLKIKFWYPEGKFVYPETGISFRDGPHRPIEIKDLFTKRNLYATSKLYSHIEKIWRKDKSQGDLLKLVFIASLANATKMMPHAKTSGPSWKLPRYWLPSLREERNFCKAFLRRLLLLHSFKKEWSAIASSYQITASFDGEIVTQQKRFIHIFRADALEIYPKLPKLDTIILDPPHYDEINYFELTYLWQKWLEGSFSDARFNDYSYWSREICVNRRTGKDLEWYNTKLCDVVSNYVNCLNKGGKVILILHNRDKHLLNETIKRIGECISGSFALKTSYLSPKIPSSAQGLHGRKKYLCILKIIKTS